MLHCCTVALLHCCTIAPFHSCTIVPSTTYTNAVAPTSKPRSGQATQHPLKPRHFLDTLSHQFGNQVMPENVIRSRCIDDADAVKILTRMRLPVCSHLWLFCPGPLAALDHHHYPPSPSYYCTSTISLLLPYFRIVAYTHGLVMA